MTLRIKLSNAIYRSNISLSEAEDALAAFEYADVCRTKVERLDAGRWVPVQVRWTDRGAALTVDELGVTY